MPSNREDLLGQGTQLAGLVLFVIGRPLFWVDLNLFFFRSAPRSDLLRPAQARGEDQAAANVCGFPLRAASLTSETSGAADAWRR